MITLLSGGTGTPKLIQGLLRVVDEEELSVIVNTAEDHWLSHGYLSPDIDTVVYTMAGIVDDTTWHGIKNDTYRTHEALKKLGSSEYLKIGDADRALHIWRGELMKKGALSKITREHCKALGVKARVIPMSDDMVETVIETRERDMDLHEFWVKNRGEPSVQGVGFKGLDKARACRDAVTAIQAAEKVIIGPSNPVTSIHPIITLPEIKEALERNRSKVIGVSPIVGASAFSGPAAKLMKAYGIEISAQGVLDFYREILCHFIMDSGDAAEIPDDVNIYKTNIVMDSLEKRKALAEFILDIEL